jgi:hypothetical protein
MVASQARFLVSASPEKINLWGWKLGLLMRYLGCDVAGLRKVREQASGAQSERDIWAAHVTWGELGLEAGAAAHVMNGLRRGRAAHVTPRVGACVRARVRVVCGSVREGVREGAP